MSPSHSRLTAWSGTATLLAAVLATAGCAAEAGPPAASGPESPSVLPVRLDLDLEVDYEGERIGGEATWTVRNVGMNPIRAVPIQIGRLMSATSVTRAGHALAYDQDVVVYEDWPELQVNQLRIRLDEPLRPGERTAITVAYGGPLVPYTETGMLYVKDHIDRSFTILRAESFAYPQIRVPSYARWMSMPRGDFTYALRVTVPPDLVVATGTLETSRSEAPDGSTWTFESDAAVPFLLVAIASYETLVDADLRVYHFPEDSTGGRRVMHAMRETLAAYAGWFGGVESRLRLHVIEIPEGWGSQADLNAGVFQTADAFRTPGELTQLYHELAHLWHPVDADSAPPRWNEGLATFLAYRWAATRGESPPLEVTFAELAARQVQRFEGSVPSRSLAMLEYGRDGVTGLSYGTGALMFYALYRTLGEKAFDRGLGRWFRAYRSTGSTSRQFMATVEETTGRDLTALFTDWLLTSGWYERLRAGQRLEELVASYR